MFSLSGLLCKNYIFSCCFTFQTVGDPGWEGTTAAYHLQRCVCSLPLCVCEVPASLSSHVNTGMMIFVVGWLFSMQRCQEREKWLITLVQGHLRRTAIAVQGSDYITASLVPTRRREEESCGGRQVS